MPAYVHEVAVTNRTYGMTIGCRSTGFKDFTALDETVPTDAKVWGELLVYAYGFGGMGGGFSR